VTLSRKLNVLFPEYLDFLNNIGSYQLMCQDYKGALKTYGKVLKKEPGNVTALQNCLLAARRMKNTKLIEKYNMQLQKYMQK
jgi:tetratricopeptide (TPR) repeat protein